MLPKVRIKSPKDNLVHFCLTSNDWFYKYYQMHVFKITICPLSFHHWFDRQPMLTEFCLGNTDHYTAIITNQVSFHSTAVDSTGCFLSAGLLGYLCSPAKTSLPFSPHEETKELLLWSCGCFFPHKFPFYPYFLYSLISTLTFMKSDRVFADVRTESP